MLSVILSLTPHSWTSQTWDVFISFFLIEIQNSNGQPCSQPQQYELLLCQATNIKNVSGRIPLVARCTRFNLMFLYLLKTGVGYTVSSPDRQVIHKKCVNHLCTVLTIYWNIHIWHTTVFFIGFMALKGINF